MKAAQRKGWPEAIPVSFLNPDPVPHFMGHSNDAPVIVGEQEMTTLINSGAQVSSISSQFSKDHALKIQPLGWLLELEGTGVLPSHTSGLWSSISRSWGSRTTTRMCC